MDQLTPPPCPIMADVVPPKIHLMGNAFLLQQFSQLLGLHSYYVNQTASEGCDNNKVYQTINNPFKRRLS